MIHNWTQNYGPEMNEVGISADAILDGKILNLKVSPIAVRLCTNFSKMMAVYRNGKRNSVMN